MVDVLFSSRLDFTNEESYSIMYLVWWKLIFVYTPYLHISIHKNGLCVCLFLIQNGLNVWYPWWNSFYPSNAFSYSFNTKDWHISIISKGGILLELNTIFYNNFEKNPEIYTFLAESCSIGGFQGGVSVGGVGNRQIRVIFRGGAENAIKYWEHRGIIHARPWWQLKNWMYS